MPKKKPKPPTGLQVDPVPETTFTIEEKDPLPKTTFKVEEKPKPPTDDEQVPKTTFKIEKKPKGIKGTPEPKQGEKKK